MARLSRRLTLTGLALVAAGGAFWMMRRQSGKAEAEAFYAAPLPAPKGTLRVYHLGHSLVGRDMPAMLAQLADAGHHYDSQLGWGTSLKEHWEPDLPINGFDQENAHPRFRPATEAITSGTYDAVVLTEMVELRDAIKYHDSARYLGEWAKLVHAANPSARIYLYETWHHINDPEGWQNRIRGDLDGLWRERVLHPALAQSGAPIHLIPAGQVMAAFVRAVETRGGVEGINGVDDLFAIADDGSRDTIHVNDLGAYLVALTHYAVLYHRDPTGLSHQLTRADGSTADAPSAEAAALMQQVVWDVVRSMPDSGVAG